MREIIVKAKATIANFGPGFDIFALALNQPSDQFMVSLSNTGSITIRLSGENGDIPTQPEKNTAGITAINLLQELKEPPGVKIEIKKGITPCAGLGTSGASASAVAYSLNRLLSLNLKDNEMIEIASVSEAVTGGAPHADNVSASLLGGFVFIRNYNPIDVIRIETPPIPIVVAIIKKSRQTTRGFIKRRYTLNQVKEQMSYCSSLIHAMISGDIKDIGRFINKDLISEPARARSIPDYMDIKKKVLDAGGYGCTISGGGSSIFVISEERKREEIAEILRKELKDIESEIIITSSGNEGITEMESN